jgi:hypothetical protein
MEHVTGRDYHSILIELEKASRPVDEGERGT